MKFRTFFLPLLLCAAILVGCYFSPELFRRVMPDHLLETETVQIAGTDSGLYLESAVGQLLVPPWDEATGAPHTEAVEDPLLCFGALPALASLYVDTGAYPWNRGLEIAGDAVLTRDAESGIYYAKGLPLALTDSAADRYAESPSILYEEDLSRSLGVEICFPPASAPEGAITFDFAVTDPADAFVPLAVHFHDPAQAPQPAENREMLLAGQELALDALLTFLSGGLSDNWLSEQGQDRSWEHLMASDPMTAADLLVDYVFMTEPPAYGYGAYPILRFYACLWAALETAYGNAADFFTSLSYADFTAENYDGETLLICTLETGERLILYYDGAIPRLSGFSMSRSFHERFFE